ESRTGVTGTAALIGTPHYMAPEQASSSRELLPAADVFSLGCIFYECLTGKHPFDAPQLAGVLARILYDKPLPIASIHPQVPEAWSDLVLRMLAKKPEDRPADGAGLVRELAALLPPSGESAASGPKAASPARFESADQVLVCVVLAIVPASSEGPSA